MADTLTEDIGSDRAAFATLSALSFPGIFLSVRLLPAVCLWVLSLLTVRERRFSRPHYTVYNNAFHVKHFSAPAPQVFLTDNDLKDRQPLQKQFPSACLLLCVFHVLKAVWSSLCDSHHGISRSNRQEIYMAFKRVLYATDEFEMSAKFDALM